MRRVYRNLLKRYPYDYRTMFAAERMSAFDERGTRGSIARRKGTIRCADRSCNGVDREAYFQSIDPRPPPAGFTNDAARRRLQGIVVSESERQMLAGHFAVGLAAYFLRRRYPRGAWILFLVVLSHWLLDFVSHRPDMALAPGAHHVYGSGIPCPRRCWWKEASGCSR